MDKTYYVLGIFCVNNIMKYNCKPIYKYSAILFIAFLFILNQEILDSQLDVLIMAVAVTWIVYLMDMTFLSDTPDLMDEPVASCTDNEYDESDGDIDIDTDIDLDTSDSYDSDIENFTARRNKNINRSSKIRHYRRVQRPRHYIN